MKQQTEWKIINRLLDGTEIKPGESLPLTPNSEKVFARAAEIIREAKQKEVA